MSRIPRIFVLCVLAALFIPGCSKDSPTQQSYFLVKYYINEAGTVAAAPTIRFTNETGDTTTVTPTTWDGFWNIEIWMDGSFELYYSATKNHAGTNPMNLGIGVDAEIKVQASNSDPYGVVTLTYQLRK